MASFRLAMGAAAVAMAGAVLVVAAGTGQPAQTGATGNTQAPAKPAAQQGGMASKLVEGLKSVDGCLGVETARTQSGKNLIIAWFKDAQAARAWYNHPTHRGMVGLVGGNPEGKKPLEHVQDGVPVMVVASITFTDKPEIKGVPMPISQIAIELYSPLPGGASINGRFAPDALKVEHMNVLK